MRLVSAVVLALAVLPLVCSGISHAACEPGQININTASATELQALKGIGPKKSVRIVEEREIRPFASVDEFTRVKGIGPKTLENNRSKICVE